jgi:uncharacterized protein YecE (DUF72 family)
VSGRLPGQGTFYLGCPIWANKAWVGAFYPPGSKSADFLALYSQRLNTVEGNTTFYATPSAATIARWREDTAPGFKFCLKFPQTISHVHRLRGAEAETAEFLERLEQLGDRCGPSFLQLPPTFGGRDLPVLLAYLDALPRRLAGYAVEVRHPDFFGGAAEAPLEAELRARGVARVLFDQRGLRSAEPDDPGTRRAQERKPNVPVRFSRTAPFALVRYIAHPTLSENAPLLDEWADQLAAWLSAGDDVFFFCHHKYSRYEPVLTRELHARLAQRIDLPPLPEWDAAEPPTITQPSLF